MGGWLKGYMWGHLQPSHPPPIFSTRAGEGWGLGEGGYWNHLPVTLSKAPQRGEEDYLYFVAGEELRKGSNQ